MSNLPFWPKKVEGESTLTPVKKRAAKAPAPPIVRALPPVLKIKVPAATKKEKKVKEFTDVPQLEMDIECYTNYFLVKFQNKKGEHYEFEMVDELGVQLDRPAIRRLLNKYEIVTFNGENYDIFMLTYAMRFKECTNAELKEVSDEIVKSELSIYRLKEKYNITKNVTNNYIDMSPLCPGVYASLKLSGARLHCTKLQELPYAEDSILTEKHMDKVNEYCGNDLEITVLLKNYLREEIELRRILSDRYGVDLRSKSDPQIAEEIIKAEMYSRTGREIRKPKDLHTTRFLYRIPEFIHVTNPKLKELLAILKTNEFVAKPVTSGITMPEQLKKLNITIGKSTYKVGIGGLHSSEKSAFHLSDDEYELWDFDVTSYYPSIILSCGLFPKSIGREFLNIFGDIVDERIEAKEAGDKSKADSLKITTNGTFGKTGSPYSILYAPELMIQVTLTGQLSLLMLINMMEDAGFEVVSGNTDGVVIKCKREKKKEMESIVKDWEEQTGLCMESTNYAGLYSRDVNNYIAIKTDGSVKVKGCFAYSDIKKNPEFDVCTDALIEYLKYGTPVEETIHACTDIRKFVTVRRVNGGAMKGEYYLGKVIRWYYSTEEKGTINYKTNNNKVPSSDGARPLMTLPKEFPTDVDYNWYVDKCKKMFY